MYRQASDYDLIQQLTREKLETLLSLAFRDPTDSSSQDRLTALSDDTLKGMYEVDKMLYVDPYHSQNKVPFFSHGQTTFRLDDSPVNFDPKILLNLQDHDAVSDAVISHGSRKTGKWHYAEELTEHNVKLFFKEDGLFLDFNIEKRARDINILGHLTINSAFPKNHEELNGLVQASPFATQSSEFESLLEKAKAVAGDLNVLLAQARNANIDPQIPLNMIFQNMPSTELMSAMDKRLDHRLNEKRLNNLAISAVSTYLRRKGRHIDDAVNPFLSWHFDGEGQLIFTLGDDENTVSLFSNAVGDTITNNRDPYCPLSNAEVKDLTQHAITLKAAEGKMSNKITLPMTKASPLANLNP